MEEFPRSGVGRAPRRSKQEIVEDLGESSLVLPGLINRGLEANDRAKYFLALVQAACAHADHPEGPVVTLREERLAAGVTDARFDDLVEGAHAVDGSSYVIPGVGAAHAGLVEAIAEMTAPLQVAVQGPDGFSARFRDLLGDAPDLVGDRIPGSYVERMASGDRRSGDSLHLLVMDAHRALNELQIDVATESLDGASVYRLDPGDRSLVSAFMAGIHSTEALRFDHPGLGTTATRSGARLLVQNDIGMTRAHVVVVTVEDLEVTVTYSDVHLERLRFFVSMLERYPVRWTEARHQPGNRSLEGYHLVVGRFAAEDEASLEGYLRHLGSRLVFLIDWNRARKRIRTVTKNREAIALLRWAADEGHGHMAFLLMGAERLVFEALELTGRVPARYGEPLREVLGTEPMIDVLRFAVRSCSEGMLAGKSRNLIRDEVRVELLAHVRAAHQQLIDLVAEHGSLVVETAQAVRSTLIRLKMPDGAAYLARASGRAVAWEHHADEILGAVRRAADRVGGADAIVRTTSRLDDAIDDLEEALFLLTLLPADAVALVCPLLETLAATTVFAAQEHLKALEIARELVEGVGTDELEDFLVSVDQVARLEHEADRVHRTARAGLVADAPDFRSLHVADLISCAMEDATDGLAHSAYLLRDHILGQVAAR